MSESMQAGRELDARVAEDVMGWTRRGQPKDYDGNHGGEPVLMEPGKSFDALGFFDLPPRGKIHLAYFTPRYSADEHAAQSVLREMARRGWRNCVEYDGTTQGFEWHVSLHHADADDPDEAFAPTLPHAICLAALLAVANS